MEISRLQPCIQLQFSKEELQNVIEKAKDWALMHGILIYKRFVVNQVYASKMNNGFYNHVNTTFFYRL